MSGLLVFPDIDPVAFQIGPIVIRWYALAYLAGLLGGWQILRRMAPAWPHLGALKRDDIDDFLVWATVGVVVGGRIGYVLFYKPAFFAANPAEILQVWHGGMSFHGGLLGVVLATWFYTRWRRVPLLPFADCVAVVAPLGLLFGRLANFINGELFGRPSSVPWAMVFPGGGVEPRHPSQLYQATLEGALLLVVMLIVSRRATFRNRPGLAMGLFLGLYGVARIAAEFFREPDPFLGFIWQGATMGQMLSLPMIAVGAGLAAFAAVGRTAPNAARPMP